MVTAAVFNGIGGQFTKSGKFWAAGVKGEARHIFAHAMAGGVLSVIQGGKFGHGFAAAGLSKALDANFNPESDAAGAFFAETAVVTIVGGTISEMTGEKFANGAITAAFQHLFNKMEQRKAYEEWKAKIAAQLAGQEYNEGVVGALNAARKEQRARKSDPSEGGNKRIGAVLTSVDGKYGVTSTGPHEANGYVAGCGCITGTFAGNGMVPIKGAAALAVSEMPTNLVKNGYLEWEFRNSITI